MKRALGPIVVVGAALGVLSLSAAGCSTCAGTSGSRATEEDISLLPPETNFVLMANVAEMRGTSLWKKVLELRDQSESSKQRYVEFVTKTGLDPEKQIDSVFAGFPTTKGSQEFGVILRGGPFDEQKIFAYLKEQSQKDGSELSTVDYNGHKLYGDKSGQSFGAFLDSKTIAMGGKEWIKKIVDLHKAGGESAAKNEALTSLVKKTKTSESFWGAGLVPEEARTSLKDDPRLQAAATMKDVYASIDVKNGFSLTGAVDLAGEPEAKGLTAKVSEQIADAKKNPQMQMMGFTQYFDAVKVSSQAATFHLDVKLTQPQVDTLVAQVSGLLKTLGSGIPGGGGGGPGDVPPAPMPTP